LKIHPEGWYHKIGNTPLGDYVSVHFLLRLGDVMRSRCGQRAKTNTMMQEFVLISSPDGWKRVFCGNCERLLEYDKSGKGYRK
jgi:hypothetical protein